MTTTNYAYVDTKGEIVTTTLAPGAPETEKLTYLPQLAPGTEKPPLMVVGMCMTCRRWRTYGEPCYVSPEHVIDLRQVITQELKAEFVELVLITQDALFDNEPTVKAAANPLFWANCTNGELRSYITLLRGIAVTNGIPLPGKTGADFLRAEVIKNIDGEDWVCLEGPNGISPLRRVEAKPEGDFACQYCGKSWKVRIAWYNHEKACPKRPVAVAR